MKTETETILSLQLGDQTGKAVLGHVSKSDSHYI